MGRSFEELALWRMRRLGNNLDVGAAPDNPSTTATRLSWTSSKSGSDDKGSAFASQPSGLCAGAPVFFTDKPSITPANVKQVDVPSKRDDRRPYAPLLSVIKSGVLKVSRSCAMQKSVPGLEQRKKRVGFVIPHGTEVPEREIRCHVMTSSAYRAHENSSTTSAAVALSSKSAEFLKSVCSWHRAGNAFARAAALSLESGKEFEAANFFQNAGECFQKVDTNRSVECLKKAVEIQTIAVSFTAAAKQDIIVAAIYEAELLNIDQAIVHSGKAEGCCEVVADICEVTSVTKEGYEMADPTQSELPKVHGQSAAETENDLHDRFMQSRSVELNDVNLGQEKLDLYGGGRRQGPPVHEFYSRDDLIRTYTGKQDQISGRLAAHLGSPLEQRSNQGADRGNDFNKRDNDRFGDRESDRTEEKPGWNWRDIPQARQSYERFHRPSLFRRFPCLGAFLYGNRPANTESPGSESRIIRLIEETSAREPLFDCRFALLIHSALSYSAVTTVQLGVFAKFILSAEAPIRLVLDIARPLGFALRGCKSRTVKDWLDGWIACALYYGSVSLSVQMAIRLDACGVAKRILMRGSFHFRILEQWVLRAKHLESQAERYILETGPKISTQPWYRRIPRVPLSGLSYDQALNAVKLWVHSDIRAQKELREGCVKGPLSRLPCANHYRGCGFAGSVREGRIHSDVCPFRLPLRIYPCCEACGAVLRPYVMENHLDHVSHKAICEKRAVVWTEDGEDRSLFHRVPHPAAQLQKMVELI